MNRILVCDDDREIVDAIEIYLQQEGYEVAKAYDGEEALAELKKQPADLLIIDVMMPRLDGIRATLKIREESSIPIIAMTANAFTEDVKAAKDAGMDAHITKPIEPGVLNRVLSEYLK